MNQTHINKTFIKLSEYTLGLILILLPFHALITVYIGSNLGHYTIVRLWKEILIGLILIPSIYYLFKSYSFKKISASSALIYLTIAYLVLSLLISLFALKTHNVNLKAFGYGLDSNFRYIIFLWLCVFVSKNGEFLKRNWLNLLVFPGVVVILFGLSQHYILPANFLSHLGYGTSTIVPYQTVDSNSAYIRLQSTLRGANPLGAYLVLILPALLIKLKNAKENTYKVMWVFLFLSGLVVLFYSYSRSAYIGAMLSIGLTVWLLAKKKAKKILLISAAALVIIMGAMYMSLRNNLTFQDTFLHTSKTTHSQSSSNQNHVSATTGAIKDAIKHPLGQGLGSAGPASVYSNKGAKISENYYVQIAQETGIIGLALFVSINVLLGIYLYKSGSENSIILLASLIGISFVNLLSHAWSDDTLSLIWFGAAGILLTPELFRNSFKPKNK